MKKPRLEWKFPILICMLIACQGLILTTGMSINHTGPMMNAESEDDAFVPFKWERFTVFDWNMFKVMGTTYNKGNLLVSPFSLKMALVLLYEGAQDETALELASVMHLPNGRWPTREKFAPILRSLPPVFNEYSLDMGTRMYLDTRVSLKQMYAADMKLYYDADVLSINFTDSSPAAAEINSWVSRVTHGNIQKMIDDDSKIRNSVMVIMNALYFKGSWLKNVFSPDDTKIDKFYTTAGTAVDVPFMKAERNFYFFDSLELDAKILRIPYVGRKFAMYFILPRTRDGLSTLTKNINPFILARQIDRLQSSPVSVKIPKFKFDFTSHLGKVLREMGIQDIFDNTATLDGVARAKVDAPPLVVTDILQKTGIEVNEHGTVAFVATEVDVGNKFGEQDFIADHPFLFYIENEITGTILYMGRISNPVETSGNTESAIESVTTGDRNTDAQAVPGAPVAESNERNNHFNLELLNVVNEQNSGNVVISPMSVKAALMALAEGTGGRTRQELLSTLRIPSDVSQIRNNARNTLTALNSQKAGGTVNVVTRLWTARNVAVSTIYGNALRTYYNSDINSVDFTNSKMAADTINDWVRVATNNHILGLVQPGLVSSDTLLLLTSAVFFKGVWLRPFDPQLTTLSCFNVPNAGCRKVRMMESSDKFKYGQISNLNTEVLSIPYADNDLTMLIFLPNQPGPQSLQTLSRDLVYTSIRAILDSLEEFDLVVKIPQFQIDTKLSLRPVLEKMGLRELFDLNSNITGILPHVQARVGSVVHNAKIQVDEQGTVAAAASAISVIPLMGVDVVEINRPFLFTIVHNPTSSILFAGRIEDPSTS